MTYKLHGSQFLNTKKKISIIWKKNQQQFYKIQVAHQVLLFFLFLLLPFLSFKFSLSFSFLLFLSLLHKTKKDKFLKMTEELI